MTVQVAKIYLQSVKYADLEINMNCLKLSRLKRMIDTATPVLEKYKSSTVTGIMNAIMAKNIDEMKLDQLIDNFIDTRLNITKALDTMPNEYAAVLAMRYLGYYGFRRISMELGISVKKAKKLHKEALEVFSTVVENQGIFC